MRRAMHVGFNLLFLIPGDTGGRETYARELIEALYGLEPGLRATAFVNHDMSLRERRRLGASMRVVRIPATARRPDSWAVGELGLLPVATVRAGVDVLHSLANFGPASGRFHRVLTVHDLQYRALPELMTPARRIGTHALISLATRHAGRIIAVSATSGRELASELGIDARRIVVIPNGVGPPAPGPVNTDALRARYALGTRRVMLTVASHLPHKNLPFIMTTLAAIHRSTRPVAVLAGTHTDDAELHAAARAAGVSDDVRLLGRVSDDELEALYALADCLVLPTRYEGFGLPVLEAMIRGVPVVCSDIPALREVTGDAALRFPPARPAQAAAAIDRILGDTQLARSLAVEGRRHAARFSWRATAAQTLAVYRELLTAG